MQHNNIVPTTVGVEANLTFGQPEQFAGWEYQPTLPLTDLACYPQFLKRIESVAETTWAANPSFERRPYQCEAAALYCCRRQNICAGSQGVGKTLIVGFCIAGLYPDIAKRRRGLVQIVAPSLLSAHSRWAVDLQRIPHLRGLVQVIAKKKDWEQATAPIWVYHQDLLTIKADKNRRRPWLAQDIGRRTPPALLVVDEVHHFKPDNQRTKALFYLRSRSRRCLALSGTLTDVRLDLIHHTCKLVYQKHWCYGSDREFRQALGCKEAIRSRAPLQEETEPTPPKRYLDFISLSRLGDYFQLLNRYVHRLSLDQPKVRRYCRLPERVDKTHVLSPSVAQVSQHRQLLQQQQEWVEQLVKYGSNGHIFSLFQPLLQLCWLPPEQEKSAKVEQLLEIVQASERVGIFVSTVEVSRWLTELLRGEFPGRVVRLYAHDPEAHPTHLKPEQRQQILEQLLFDPHIKVGVLSLNLSAESIDLTSLSDVVFWSLNWSSLQVSQALARAIRPGSPYQSVRVHWLYHTGLLDEHQVKLLLEKLRASRRLLDYDPYLTTKDEWQAKEILRELTGELA